MIEQFVNDQSGFYAGDGRMEEAMSTATGTVNKLISTRIGARHMFVPCNPQIIILEVDHKTYHLERLQEKHLKRMLCHPPLKMLFQWWVRCYSSSASFVGTGYILTRALEEIWGVATNHFCISGKTVLYVQHRILGKMSTLLVQCANLLY